jgi:glycyl-tRNA synthetase
MKVEPQLESGKCIKVSFVPFLLPSLLFPSLHLSISHTSFEIERFSSYARTDELGIPFAITLDPQTLEDATVTLRERDSTKQIRVKVQ